MKRRKERREEGEKGRERLGWADGEEKRKGESTKIIKGRRRGGGLHKGETKHKNKMYSFLGWLVSLERRGESDRNNIFRHHQCPLIIRAFIFWWRISH